MWKCGSWPLGTISHPNLYPKIERQFTWKAWFITTPEKKFCPGRPWSRTYNPISSTLIMLGAVSCFILAFPWKGSRLGSLYLCRYASGTFGGLFGLNARSNMCCMALSWYWGTTREAISVNSHRSTNASTLCRSSTQ